MQAILLAASTRWPHSCCLCCSIVVVAASSRPGLRQSKVDLTSLWESICLVAGDVVWLPTLFPTKLSLYCVHVHFRM